MIRGRTSLGMLGLVGLLVMSSACQDPLDTVAQAHAGGPHLRSGVKGAVRGASLPSQNCMRNEEFKTLMQQWANGAYGQLTKVELQQAPLDSLNIWVQGPAFKSFQTVAEDQMGRGVIEQIVPDVTSAGYRDPDGCLVRGIADSTASVIMSYVVRRARIYDRHGNVKLTDTQQGQPGALTTRMQLREDPGIGAHLVSIDLQA